MQTVANETAYAWILFKLCVQLDLFKCMKLLPAIITDLVDKAFLASYLKNE
jgi:hypothetical protein